MPGLHCAVQTVIEVKYEAQTMTVPTWYQKHTKGVVCTYNNLHSCKNEKHVYITKGWDLQLVHQNYSCNSIAVV